MRFYRPNGSLRCLSAGFSLIELLVVMAIIGILAAMIMGGIIAGGKQKYKAAIDGQLSEIQTAIEEYHAKKGAFPPSSTNLFDQSPLYYELVGTVYNKGSGQYETLDGQQKIELKTVKDFFKGVNGFLNSGLKKEEAENYYPNLKQKGHSAHPLRPASSDLQVLSVPVKSDSGFELYWHYNSFNPTNNPGRYDLWVEWVQKGQPTVIGNFKR